MADKIRCADCEHCKRYRRVGNARSQFTCEHPNQRYIADYFRTHKMKKMEGVIGFGAKYSEEVPIKTSPAWCPKKAGNKNE